MLVVYLYYLYLLCFPDVNFMILKLRIRWYEGNFDGKTYGNLIFSKYEYWKDMGLDKNLLSTV